MGGQRSNTRFQLINDSKVINIILCELGKSGTIQYIIIFHSSLLVLINNIKVIYFHYIKDDANTSTKC